MGDYWVYEIINNNNGKVYIGKTNDLNKRWNYHKSRLRRNLHNNTHLQNSWNKHGEDSFTFRVIDNFDTDEEAINMEIEEIKLVKGEAEELCYNLTDGGEGSAGLFGERSRNSVVDKETALSIYYEYNKNTEVLQKELAEKYGVCYGVISQIINHHHWTTEKMPVECRIEKNNYAGIKNSKAKLTKEDCLKIYDLYYNQNLTQTEIAEKYNVDQGAISRVVLHKHSYTKIIPEKDRFPSKVTNRKLNKEICLEIFKVYKEGNFTQLELSKRYDIPQGTISKIVRKEHWSIRDLTKEEILGREGDN